MKGLVPGILFASLFLLPTTASRASEVGVEVGSKIKHFTMKTVNPKLAGKRMLSSRHLIGPSAKHATKVLGLTFGASYCEPCKKELRILAAQSDHITKAGSTLVAVVIDKKPEGIEAMRKLIVDDLKIDFPVLSDRFGILARRYRASTLPMMVIINAEGIVEWTHTGLDENALKTFLKYLGLTKKQLNRL